MPANPLSLFLAAILVASLSTVSTAGPFALDASFGTDGVVVTDLGGRDAALAVAVESSGTATLVAGATDATPTVDFTIVKYTSDGRLDRTFGHDGMVLTDFDGAEDVVRQILPLPDGAFLVAGTSSKAGRGGFALARYRQDGTLDETFGGGGKITTFFGAKGRLDGVVQQVDGKFIAGGLGAVLSGEDFALARYNSDGSLDQSFGNGGLVITDFVSEPTGSRFDSPKTMLLLQSGMIVLAGNSDSDLALARYRTDGTLDPTFGTGGQVITFAGNNYFEAARSLVELGDGSLLVAAQSAQYGGLLARYDSNGILDVTFAGSGLQTGTPAGNNGMFLDVNGGILMGIAGSGPSYIGLRRYLGDGAPDLTFGVGGVARFALSKPTFTYAVGQVGMGSFAFVGSTTDGTLGAKADFFIARLSDDTITTTTTTTSSSSSSTGSLSTNTTTTAPPLSVTTTTTTLPCASVRCALDAVLFSSCAHDNLPANIIKKLNRAAGFVEQAASTPTKQRKLHRRAKMALKGASRAAAKAATGKHPKLSGACAEAIGRSIGSIVGGL